jgi:cytochrome oxidase Cu insertion factor (SCO1/SenC/PrrC family)
VKTLRMLAGIAAFLAVALASPALAQTPAARVLGPGDKAPDFTLLSDDWKEVKLSDFRGKKNVVLVFYVLAFTET